MSEIRRPAEIWMRRLPGNDGKKAGENCTLKIELFPAHYWREHWEPASVLWSPKLPLKSESRREYWTSRYRIRVNGVWVGTRAKYVTYSKEQIRERYFR